MGFQRTVAISQAEAWTSIVDEGDLWGVPLWLLPSSTITFERLGDRIVVRTPGGRVGDVAEIAPPDLVRWRWRDAPLVAPVELTLAPVGDGRRTLVRVNDGSVPPVSEDGLGWSWVGWGASLADWVAFPRPRRDLAAPMRDRVRALWHPTDSERTEREVGALLGDERPPWAMDWAVVIQLQALEVRAVAARGDLVAARERFRAAFAGVLEAPPWVAMLWALERGRLLAFEAADRVRVSGRSDEAGWVDAASSMASVLAQPPTDVDLALEAVLELAGLPTPGDGRVPSDVWRRFGASVSRRARREVGVRWREHFL